MPTPSELQSERPRRSVFGNYHPAPAAEPRPGAANSGAGSAALRRDAATLQDSIDTAVARTFLYRFFAKAFEDPEPEGWSWLTASEVTGALRSAAGSLAPGSGSSLAELSDGLARQFTPTGYDGFASAYLTCFGHTVRGDCPMNEIAYGAINAAPLFPARSSPRSASNSRRTPPSASITSASSWNS